MEKKGTYAIIVEKPLIVEYYEGIITVKDLFHFKNEIKKEPNYNLYTNTILDFRFCTLNIETEELPEIINYLKRNFSKSGNRKVAYLTSRPNEVVVTTLYKQVLADTDINYNPETFSTVRAIANYFGSGLVREKELFEIIEELKTKPDNVYNK